MMPSSMPPPPEVPGLVAGGAVAPMGAHPVGAMGHEDMSLDGRKAKRELSQSKRAAQNRAAQRAFRQRKEGYIKKLESQVRDYLEMEESFKSMQAENYHLRDYVLMLQSKLLDVKAECPPPPPGINLNQPHLHGGPPPVQLHPIAGPDEGAHGNSMMAPPGNPLAQVAQAVAQLGDQAPFTTKGFKPDSQQTEDQRTEEEISRQLQHADGLPTASM